MFPQCKMADMDKNTGLVKSPFTISKLTSGVTYESTDFADAARWVDLLTYDVPLGTAVEVTPVNYLFADLKNTGATAITAGMSRLVKTNASETEERELWSGSNGIFKDIGDEFQRPKVRVPIIVNSSQKLKFQVYNLGTTLDVSASNVFIEAVQYYEEI